MRYRNGMKWAPLRPIPFWIVGFAWAVASLVLDGCAETRLRAPLASSSGVPLLYQFPLPNGESIGTDALAGRWTVLLFLTTYDTVSQAIARRLDEYRHTRTPRINVLAIALEPPQNAPLVAVYRDTLGIGFPVALADQDTLDGRGPFGDVRSVPELVLLDRDSKVVRRGTGVGALAEIESILNASAGESR